MDTFLPTLFPFLFKAMIVLIPVSLALKTLRIVYIDKTINAYIALPPERKERIIRLYRSTISISRIFLWIMPFGLLLVLAVFVLLFVYPALASGLPGVDLHQLVTWMGIALIFAFIHFAEDSYYKKKVLKAIDKPES